MINITLENLKRRVAEQTLERCHRCHEPDVELIEIDGKKLCPGCVHETSELCELFDAEPRGAMDPFDPEVP